MNLRPAFDAGQGRTSWGVSGALYLQSATAEMISRPRFCAVPLASVSGDEETVLRNENL